MSSSWISVGLAAVLALAGTVTAGAQDTAAPSATKVAKEPSFAVDPPDPAEVAADALVVRPLGLAATVIGSAIYVVALPFAAISGDVKSPGRSLVGAPANFTFKRRLGDFNQRTL